MKFELNIKELGEILKKINQKYKLKILVKSNLSGGWMTINGDAEVTKIPTLTDNIIHIKVDTNDDNGATIKLTGNKDKKFNIDVSNTRYREISKNGLTLNMIKEKEDECKLRIDDNIIFTINDSEKEISEIINKL